MATGTQYGSVIFGGLFLGIWLYIALFGLPDDWGNLAPGAWVLWGVVGLALATAIYGTRVTEGAVRITIYAVLGVAIGMVLMAVLAQNLEEGIAAIITFVGGGLIVSALPRPN